MSSESKKGSFLDLYHKRWFNILNNLFLAGMYVFMVVAMVENYIETHEISSLLIIFFEAIIIILVLARRKPKEFTYSIDEWFYAFAGTMAPLLLRPVLDANDSLILEAILISGIIIYLFGAVSLGRSFGVVPANRGVKTSGLYKFVRHPVYFGYAVTYIGFVSQHLSLRNIIVITVFFLFQALRIVCEEEFLSKDKEYREFKKKTRWRLIPFVW